MPWYNDGNGNTVTSLTHIAKLNSVRYRSYCYDNETGLYYVISRYYNAQIGRWLNADSYISTGQGVLGNNMFAYCENNPINRIDPTGTFWQELCNAFSQTLQQSSGYFAVAAGVSQLDTLAPGPADLVAGVLMLGGLLFCAGVATYTAITAPAISTSIPKVEEKEKDIVLPDLPSDTVIFRWPDKGTLNVSYTPSDTDLKSTKYGLSFSTVPKPGSVMTTIGALNATGIVIAKRDGITHISVFPVGGTLASWYAAGPNSHWSLAVQSVCVKWDGN